MRRSDSAQAGTQDPALDRPPRRPPPPPLPRHLRGADPRRPRLCRRPVAPMPARRMFERDKDELRGFGMPIETIKTRREKPSATGSRPATSISHTSPSAPRARQAAKAGPVRLPLAAGPHLRARGAGRRGGRGGDGCGNWAIRPSPSTPSRPCGSWRAICRWMQPAGATLELVPPRAKTDARSPRHPGPGAGRPEAGHVPVSHDGQRLRRPPHAWSRSGSSS